MSHSKRPANEAGRSVVDLLAGKRQASGNAAPAQPTRHVPLLRPATRAEARDTAQAFSEAAGRCKREATRHPGTTGQALVRLAAHYARQSAEWFSRADTLPEVMA